MPGDSVTAADVRHVLANGFEANPQNDARTKWKIVGPLSNGDDYAVIVVIRDNGFVFVVTCHYPP
jgi:hypothetical protein